MNDKEFDRQFITTKTLIKDLMREIKTLKIDPRLAYFVLSETTNNMKIALDQVYGKDASI